MLVIIPIIVFLFIAQYFEKTDLAETFFSPLTMAVIDEDDIPYTDMLIGSFKKNDKFSQFVKVVDGDNMALRSSFEKGDLDVLVIVPKGFYDAMMAFETMPVEIVISYNDPVKTILIKNVVDSYQQYVRSVESGIYLMQDELLARGLSWSEVNPYRERILVELIFTALARQSYFEEHEILNVPKTNAMRYYFIALMVMFIMYLSIYSAVTLIREKEEMCLRRLKIANISFLRYLMAKAGANSVYMFLVICVWYLLYFLFFGQITEGHMLLMILFTMVSIFFNVCLSLAFTIFFQNEEPVILLSSIVIFLNAILGGSVIPIHNMPEILQKMAKLTPNYWMIRGFLFIDSNYEIQSIGQISMLLCFVGLCLLLLTSLKYTWEEM